MSHFFGFGQHVLAALFCVFIMIGVIKGISGIGMPLVGVPAMSPFVDVRDAIFLLAIPVIITNVRQAMDRRGQLMRVSDSLCIMIAFVPGCAIGTALISSLDRKLALTISGILLLTILIAQVFFRQKIETLMKARARG